MMAPFNARQAAGVKQSFSIDDIGIMMAPFNARGYNPPSDQENDELFRNRKMHLLGDISVLIIEIESLLEIVKYCIKIMNKVKQEKDEVNDGWDVFRFQISEEIRTNTKFNTVHDFLEYWFHECNKRQKSSSRIEPMYMEKRSKKQPGQEPTGVAAGQASKRYKKLSYSDRAINRAIAKEYFRKRGSTAAYTDADIDCSSIIKRFERILKYRLRFHL